jgi:uncharacterized protein YfaT (DUF1175 family)
MGQYDHVMIWSGSYLLDHVGACVALAFEEKKMEMEMEMEWNAQAKVYL